MANEKRLIDANILESWIDGGIQGAEEANGNAPVVSLYDVLDELDNIPTVDAVEVVHGRWEDGRCSNCQEEALSTSWDEPIYDYDWEENLRYSHTETHTEYHLTDYCPNCGAKMDGDGNGDS